MKGQLRPYCGGSFSGGCEDSLAVVAEWCAPGGLMERKVSGFIVSAESRRTGPEDRDTLVLGPGI